MHTMQSTVEIKVYMERIAFIQNGLYPIHQAIMRNDPIERNQLIQSLMNKGADVNSRALKVSLHPMSNVGC